MNPYIPIIVSVVAAAGTVFAAWLTVRVGRRKVAADATQTLTGIALSLVEPLKAEIDELKKELDHMEREIGLLKRENEILHRWSQLLFSQVVESGGDPISFEQVQKWSDNG